MLMDKELLRLSATDLVGHVNCRYLTSRDLKVARGELEKPVVWDPVLEVLAERGALHEQSYLNHLEGNGLSIVTIDGKGIDAIPVAQTLEAMRAGASVIAQGALQAAQWGGRPDILCRVEKPSALGTWSYEVIDTKLARETKGNTVLQISLYSDLLSEAQKLAPEFAHVITPGTDFEPLAFRFADYAAYYRRVRKSLELALSTGSTEELYPEPKPHCDICRWRLQCGAKWRADDHLTLVAGISKSQIGELARHDVTTVAELATVAMPLPWKPDRGAVRSYEKIREQARIQVQGRTEDRVVYETLTPQPGFGLSCLPAPSDGDIFLDFEGDPFVDEGGLEFLFGYAFRESDAERYVADWALSRTDEKAAFERFVDMVIARLETYPDLHIYHYAPYEPAALKRLMGRYATRENEIDRMLRAGLFVDLYSVVRHGIRASVESYSIKKLEPLYGFERMVGLLDASAVLAKVQASLELGDFDAIAQEQRNAIEGYNRDDCLSAWRLRDWLETVRSGLLAGGATIDRPPPKTGEASPDLGDWQQKIAALVARLIHDVPVDPADQTAEQRGRWLLAHVLDFHRREDKAVWWEYFRLSALSGDELLDERAGLSGLTFIGTIGGTAKAPIHRYGFPPQDTDLRGDEDLQNLGGAKFGKVAAISLEERTVDIKKRQDTASVHPEAVFAHTVIGAQELANSLVRIGEYVADHGLLGEGPYQAARDLLLVAAPRVGGMSLREADETVLAAAMRIAPKIECGILPVQGPPGAGKTHIGARMICALTKAAQNVGITANSHKVIRNMLDEVLRAADELGTSVLCMQKVSEKEDDLQSLRFTTDNGKLLAAIGTSCKVAAGTAWLWARADAFQSVDTLFIDEAAQMSLANVLAVSQAAKSIVLLGDPRQLEQPMQGSHPEGCDVSALTHILGPHATIPADRGLFLEETWRLHPEICAFTSELFYESRLRSRPGLELQEIKSNGRIFGSGLRYLPVIHEGNQSSSPEEADKIKGLVEEILASNATWVDREGKEARLKLKDILIIAPYNAQVFELQDRIPGGRIGTVDKFQGQEAPIVIYSITTSSYLDAPRGMEFLYSANRLNVASSRARAICVLVGTPAIFEAECRTPRQMQLANAFCRYLEMAEAI
jgi:predicted RecB family nuclease